MKADVCEGLLVTYSKVKRINRGYITRYTIKLTLRDQENSNMMIIEEIKIIIVCYYDKIFLQFIDMGDLECTTGHRYTDTGIHLMEWKQA